MKKKAPSKAVKKQMPMPNLNIQPQTNNVNFQMPQIQQVPVQTNVRRGMYGNMQPPRLEE